MQHENIHISTDVIINAPRQIVWQVLSDLEKWPEWTSLMLSAKGTFKKGSQLILEFVSPDGGSIVFERSMFLFEEGKVFGWTGDAFAGLKDFHVFELEDAGNGRTRLIQSDGLHGADIPGVEEIEKQMLEGYKVFNQELKQLVESGI